MGSSLKKKNAKKKDFQVYQAHTSLSDASAPAKKPIRQKPKLKVGKARPKPNNLTDTSFKSKCKGFFISFDFFFFLFAEE